MNLPVYANNATTTLVVDADQFTTTLTVEAGTGALFPNPTNGDYAWLTLSTAGGLVEIVKCTSRSTDILTVIRGQQGTTATIFPLGSALTQRMTAQGLSDNVTIAQTQATNSAASAAAALASEAGVAASASAAAASAVLASAQVALAADQVVLATTQATNAASSAVASDLSAQLAQSYTTMGLGLTALDLGYVSDATVFFPTDLGVLV